MKRTEFNKDILNAWIANGFKYVVTEQINPAGPLVAYGQFIIYPLIGREDTERFILRKNVGTPYALQQTIVCYDIFSEGVNEIAAGIFGYSYFPKETPLETLQTVSPQMVEA